MASEVEFDLQGTVDWGKKWLVDFIVGKTQLVSFNRSNNNSSVDVKMDGSVLEEQSAFNPLSTNPINWQIADKLFECAWPFC